MLNKLNHLEKDAARRAPLVNARLNGGNLAALNVFGGELYWGVRDRDNACLELLSPEGEVARIRGVHFAYAACPPFPEREPTRYWVAAGADSHEENVVLAAALQDVAEWLGYTSVRDYTHDCQNYPEEVRCRLNAAK